MQVVKELDEVEVASALGHSRRRVIVLRRDDGNYSFAEQYFDVSEYEGKIIAEQWVTLDPQGIYVTAAIAERDALAAFAKWYGSAD